MCCLVRFYKKYFALIVSCFFGILGLIFLACGISDGLAYWFFNGKIIKDFFTASGSSCAASALMYTAWCYQNDSKQKASKKYLEAYIEIFRIILSRLQSQLSLRRIGWITASSHADKILKIEKK